MIKRLITSYPLALSEAAHMSDERGLCKWWSSMPCDLLSNPIPVHFRLSMLFRLQKVEEYIRAWDFAEPEAEAPPLGPLGVLSKSLCRTFHQSWQVLGLERCLCLGSLQRQSLFYGQYLPVMCPPSVPSPSSGCRPGNAPYCDRHTSRTSALSEG